MLATMSSLVQRPFFALQMSIFYTIYYIHAHINQFTTVRRSKRFDQVTLMIQENATTSMVESTHGILFEEGMVVGVCLLQVHRLARFKEFTLELSGYLIP